MIDKIPSTLNNLTLDNSQELLTTLNNSQQLSTTLNNSQQLSQR